MAETDNTRPWELDFNDPEDDDGVKKAVAAELQKMLTVAQHHDAKLRDLREVVTADPVMHSAVDVRVRIGRLDVRPPERAPALELIQTGERSLRKVLAVLAFVCDEARELQDIADAHFLPGILSFGDPPANVASFDEGDEVGAREQMFGRALPFFQEMANFVERCHSCALNLVQQLAALYSPKQESYVVTFKDVRLGPVFDALADLLALLVLLDLAVANNDALANAWTDYKRLLQRVRADPTEWARGLFPDGDDNASESQDCGKRLARFERLLADVDRLVLRASCFRACAEMDFEALDDQNTLEDSVREQPTPRTEKMNVRQNPALLKEFDRAVKTFLDRTNAVVGTPTETGDRQKVVGLVALYAFSRRLAPPSFEPDAKLFRALWQLEKKVPVVPLADGRALPFFVADFLLDHAPPPPGSVRKLDPPVDPAALRQARRDACQKFDATFETDAKALELQRIGLLAKAHGKFNRSPKGDDNVARTKGVAAATEMLLEQRGALLLQALALAHAHANVLRSVVGLHVATSTPFSKKALMPLVSIVDGMKALEKAFTSTYAATIAESTSGALRALAQALLAQLGPVRVKLERKRYASTTAGRLDALAAVDAASTLLATSDAFSASRVNVLGLAFAVAFNDKTAPETAPAERRCKDRAAALTKRLGLLCTLEPRLHKACDCSTLYFSRELLEPALAAVSTSSHASLLQAAVVNPKGGQQQQPKVVPSAAARCGPTRWLPHLVAAAADAAHVLRAAQHVEDPEVLVNGWRTFVVGAVDKTIILPLCHKVENDLRVRAHTLGAARVINSQNRAPTAPNRAVQKVVGDDDDDGAASPTTTANSTNGAQKRKDAADGGALALMAMPPLRILDVRIDIGRRVGAYLEKVFYDLTVVALHDWATYAEMRVLAKQSYGLDIRDNHLPMGSLDVGLDVLRIMQNIDVFVSRFSYNLNQQNFVERRPDRGSKNVRAINIHSIASSLRQHGLGVLNTTVNYTYQFLAQKFHVFSQFLYDDYIRSHLSKERRWFRKNRDACNSMYPYEKAADFVRDIRKLGVADDGKTFLDHFRVLVTEIGNALGYVRMVRSAAAEFCADAARFVPDFDAAANFANDLAGKLALQKKSTDEGKEEPSEEEPEVAAAERHKVSAGTREAAANLASVIDTLGKNFSEGRDYFKVLVNVFQKVLLSGEHGHLDNFYMIVPALCTSWVEASLVAKDRMFKQNRQREAYYADDGFAVGLAYVLAILGQGSRFDSLHWFDRVRDHLLQNEKELDQRLAAREKKRLAREERKKLLKAQQSSTFSFLSSRKATEDSKPDDDDDDDDDDAGRALQLTGRRIKATKRENELLFFSISGPSFFVPSDFFSRCSRLLPERRCLILLCVFWPSFLPSSSISFCHPLVTTRQLSDSSSSSPGTPVCRPRSE